MVTNQRLFSVGTFDFRFQHLLIIGILLISFSISMMIRSQPANYGLELNEFDPFFNYRATQYLLENGIDSYNSWHDEMSWHPYGRDVSNTSQIMLHITAATLYKIFGFGSNLYDFVILFPVVFISLSSIVIFALVRILGGTTSGLIASLLFSISYPIAIRGFIGWFKSEPLGIFFGLLTLYLLLSGIYANKKRISFTKVLFAGLFLSFGLSSWGGVQFFLLPISTFIFSLPFLRKDIKFILYAISIFTASTLLFTLMFERPGLSFVVGYGGLFLISPVIFISIFTISKKFISKKFISYILLILVVAIPITLILGEQIGMPSFRYINAIDPTLVSHVPLVDSISEHLSVSTKISFSFFSILLIFSGIGIWFLFKSHTKFKKEIVAFILFFSLFGSYVSAVFIRLEVFTAISIVILSSIGISFLLTEILKNQNNSLKQQKNKIIFLPIMIFLISLPLVFPENNWVASVSHPPTIMTGGNTFGAYSNDWIIAMDWIKNNTEEDAVIASWWDYGYWITTLGERKTIVDNATLIDWQIQKLALSFSSTPENAWHILNSDYKTNISNYMDNKKIKSFGGSSALDDPPNCIEDITEKKWCNPVTRGLDADYVLLYITATPIPSDSPNQLYLLNGGGDFQKKIWFFQIAEMPLDHLLLSDRESGTDFFWEQTLLGNLIPFSPIHYADSNTGQISNNYFPGATTLYIKNIKYFKNDDPFQLVYASTSFFTDDDKNKISGVLLYKINKKFIPQ